MNRTQQQIINLAKHRNIATMTLREIAEVIGVDTPQLVQHHINQLVKKGFLWIDRKAGKMQLLPNPSESGLLRIPILGAADCGPATRFADDTIPEGYLPIASTLLGLRPDKAKDYFAVRAVGNSMNRAKVQTFGNQKAGIDDGDIVIVDSSQRTADNKSYIVAVVEGLANIKKLVLGDGVALLESESTVKHMPIYLDPEQEDFIAGKVVGVVKG